MIHFLNKLKEVKFVNLKIKKYLVSSVRLVTTYHALSPGPLASIKTFLTTQPLASNCIIHGLLYTGSEFLQQTIMVIGGEAEEEEGRGYDTGPLVRCHMYIVQFMHVLKLPIPQILDLGHSGAARDPVLLVPMAGRQVRGPGRRHHRQEDHAGPVRHVPALLCHLLQPHESHGGEGGHHTGAQVKPSSV